MQDRLPVHVQQEILAELHTLESVRETLDIVDIVLGFLSSGGGNTDKLLGEYVEKVLRMKGRKLSQKVKPCSEHCVWPRDCMRYKDDGLVWLAN